MANRDAIKLRLKWNISSGNARIAIEFHQIEMSYFFGTYDVCGLGDETTFRSIIRYDSSIIHLTKLC